MENINIEKEKTCQEANPIKDIVVHKNNGEDDLTATIYPFKIKEEYKIDIRELIDYIKRSIDSNSRFQNKKLIGDIEVMFTCDTAIRAEYGSEGLFLRLNYNLINENEILQPNLFLETSVQN